jgi:hypothetical protein
MTLSKDFFKRMQFENRDVNSGVGNYAAANSVRSGRQAIASQARCITS